MEYRINGFEQIKAFYSWVFNNAKERVTPQHISLYLFLINQNNRSNWIEWFKVPFDLGMAGACIGNKKTYYSCLNDLVLWKLIEYEKGTNEYKAPLIKIVVLKSTSHDTANVPLPEPLLQPQGTTLHIPLPTHIYKLITDNLKPITDNIEEFEKFILSLPKTGKEPTWKNDFQVYLFELKEAYVNLISDKTFITAQEKYHTNVDIKLSIEKAVVNYWSTDEGWQHKKKSKTDKINWKSTLTKAIDMNKVYKPRTYEQKQEPSTPKLNKLT